MDEKGWVIPRHCRMQSSAAGNIRSFLRERVKKLIDEVRSLEIPEMDGNGITISVGLAFSPEHGTTFMELYRHADTALYQVKQGGRNGFSVYEKAN